MSEEKEQQRKPAFATAKEKAKKGRRRVEKANKRARKIRDLLRKQHSVPDDPRD